MSRPNRKLIVLDRDGVINADSDDYVKSPEEWRPLPGSLDAIARLCRAGYDVVVATNQSGIGRGIFTRDALDAIHARMHADVAAAGGEIKAIYVCPHRPEDDCSCRKPRPGLLERIAEDFGRPLEEVPFVGDKLTDVQSAVAAGARPIFVQTPEHEADVEGAQALGAAVYPSLARAADSLLTPPRRGSLRQWIGSLLFTLFLFISVVIYAPLVVLTAPLPSRVAYQAVLHWIDAQLWMLEKLCGLRYEIEGREHLPSVPSVVLMKHSSAWETIAQLRLFPRQTWVLKRELMWAPFLGWALARLRPIAIDRRGGRAAIDQVIAQGRERLAEGLWVVIFPEGTRVPFGQTGRFGLGGALLAAAVGKPVIPVAHDAGRYWPRRGWLKRGGTIRVRIGPPIETAGREARDVTADVRAWIEQALTELGTTAPAPTPASPGAVGDDAGPVAPRTDTAGHRS